MKEFNENIKKHLTAMHSQNAEENSLDIRKLIETIWKSKWVILMIVVIFASVSSVVVNRQPNKWVGKVTVEAPDASDWLETEKIRKKMQFLGVENTIFTREKIFLQFIENLQSKILLSKFIRSHRIDQRGHVAEGLTSTGMFTPTIQELRVRNLDFINGRNVKNSLKPSWEVLVTVLDSSEASKRYILKYLDYVATETREQIISEMKATVDARLYELNEELKFAINKEQITREQALMDLQNALRISRVVGTKKEVLQPLPHMGNEVQYLISLGEDAILEMMHIKEEHLNDYNFNSVIGNIKYKIDNLEKMTLPNSNSFSVYHIKSNESISLFEKERYRKLAIIILSSILGFIVAVFGVIIKSFLFRAQRV